MKLKAIFFLITSATILHQARINATENEFKCETEGCYEVIKTFVKLLNEKINETDKILAEAEKELNEVTDGNDENFRDKINEINLKISRLIIDLNTGIDAGEQTLIELINSVFEPLIKAEKFSTEIEIEMQDGVKTIKIVENTFSELQEVVKKVNEEIRKLENSTVEDLPKALQDAFDKSEKFHSDSKDIREIYEKMKIILADYEKNLVNAKMLTLDALEKFATINEKITEKERIEKEIEQIFKIFEGYSFNVDNLSIYKKLSKEASEQANSVFEEAFELLNDVTIFDIDSLLNEIESKINELENYASDGEGKLKKFVGDNSKFLDELEAKLDAAEKLEERALKQQENIEEKLKEIEEYMTTSAKAIKDKDDTIKSAKNILMTLEDFVINVEESRELARRAFELIPEILQKIKDAEAIIEDLEEKVERSVVIGNEAKEKSFQIKNEIEKVLEERENLQNDVNKLSDDVTEAFEQMNSVLKQENELSDKMDKLKKSAGENEDLIGVVRSKSARTKTRGENVHKDLDDAIENIQTLIAEIEAARMIDDDTLDEFEKKLNEAESEFEATQLSQKIKNLREKREEQNELIKNYKVEMAKLEHELAILEENVKSLETRCFRRTQLEP